MSKMPGKKSCFQITSVTQAQVNANNIPDDTESLDDPDDSRTDDIPPEKFDFFRTDQGACARNCSEESLQYGEDTYSNITPVNGGLSARSSGCLNPRNVPGNVVVPTFALSPSSVSLSPSLTGVTHAAPIIGYNSRFRVIKLDHGTGEPFRRGRWICTEFYERDLDLNRSVDTIKSSGGLEQNVNRDSGLGATSNSIITTSSSSAQGWESATDGSYSQPFHLESQQQDYTLPPRKDSGAGAFQPTTVSQQPKLAHVSHNVNMQTSISQTLLSNSLNDLHPGAVLQMSPSGSPSSPFPQIGHSANLSVLPIKHPDHPQSHLDPANLNLPLTSPRESPTNQISPSHTATLGLMKQRLGLETDLALQGAASSVFLVKHSLSQMPLSSPTIISHSGEQNVTVLTPTTISITHGVTGLLGAHRGSMIRHSSEDGLQRSDILPQHTIVMPGKDDIKEFFNLPIPTDVDDDSASGASAVAIDNKIEQAMDLVKSHLMYAVREEVEVLKEQIKELYERNSVLERENAVLKSLANTEQLNQLTTVSTPFQQFHHLPIVANNASSLLHHEGNQNLPFQPNISSA